MQDRIKDMVHFTGWFDKENIEKTRLIFKQYEEIAKELGGSCA